MAEHTKKEKKLDGKTVFARCTQYSNMVFDINATMKKMVKWYLKLNIYCKLIPFLILYLSICILFSTEKLVGDEVRYIWFARNLVNGFYSPPFPDINLWNGPGYPAFLAALIFLKIPLQVLPISNGILLYFSLVICYNTIHNSSSKKNAFLFTVLLGSYFPIFQSLPICLSESLTWFLVSLVCFLFLKNYETNHITWKLILITAAAIAFLAMTKVIFGQVIIGMIFVSSLLLLLPHFRASAKKAILIFLTSLIFCLPWLFYTYSLTAKPFYWTNSGGMSLYTMSTPYANEHGDWQNIDQLSSNPNHAVLMDSVLKLDQIQRDDAFKIEAVKNIKNHPAKYISNLICNIGRLLFFPSSNAPQTLLSYHAFIPNMFIVVIIFVSMAISLVQYRRLPQPIILIFLFILIYLMGCTLVSTYRRMFYITMPFWALFISYVFNNIISVKIKHNES